MSKEGMKNKLKRFGEEFGKILEPVEFLKEKNPDLCSAFLELHELTLNEGELSKKHKFLIHAAVTASQHNLEATYMHILGAVNAGASEHELLETSFTLIPVSGMPAFAVFLNALKRLKEAKNES
jgi:alkylhydroperoxidase/carboxymuconolactone decarboxylase family protein YurZ